MPRLDHLLARNLEGARARARALIAAGQVRDPGSGAPLEDPRLELAEASLPFAVDLADGETPPRRVTLRARCDLMLNKPAGYLSALEDRRHPVAYALLRGAPLAGELRPVGRLDLDTTGLLLWTTDGTWLHALTHPKRRVPRTYQAALARPFAADAGAPPALTLADGHRPEIVELANLAASDLHPALARPADTVAWARITIIGGAYHEVRRIFAALGNHVTALCRVAFGRLTLPPDLAPGEYRLIDPGDV